MNSNSITFVYRKSAYALHVVSGAWIAIALFTSLFMEWNKTLGFKPFTVSLALVPALFLAFMSIMVAMASELVVNETIVEVFKTIGYAFLFLAYLATGMATTVAISIATATHILT